MHRPRFMALPLLGLAYAGQARAQALPPVTVQNATPYAIYVHPLKQHCQVKPFLTIRGGTTSVYSRADLGNPDELRIHTYFGVYSAGQAVMAHPIVLVKPVSHRHDDGHWVADACTVVTREQAE